MEKINIKDLDLLEKKQSFVIGFFLGLILTLCFFTAPIASADFSESDLPFSVESEEELLAIDKEAHSNTYSLDYPEIIITRANTTWYTVFIYYFIPDDSLENPVYVNGSNVEIHRDNIFYTFDTNGSGSDSENWIYTFNTSYYDNTTGTSSFAYATTDILYSSVDICTDSSCSSIFHSSDSGIDIVWEGQDADYTDLSLDIINFASDYKLVGLSPASIGEYPEFNYYFTPDSDYAFSYRIDPISSNTYPTSYTFVLKDSSDVVLEEYTFLGSGYSDLGYFAFSLEDRIVEISTTVLGDYTLEFYADDSTEADVTVYSTLISGTDTDLSEFYSHIADISVFESEQKCAGFEEDSWGYDICRFIIPSEDYLPNLFSYTWQNFISKFGFLDQTYYVLDYARTAYSGAPTAPIISQDFNGIDFTLDFSTFSDGFTFMRNLSSVGLILSTLYLCYVQLKSFLSSEEESVV